MQTVPTQPVFLNVESIFAWLYVHLAGFFKTIFSIEFFHLLQFIAGIFVVLLITLVLYCLVRLYEFAQEDKKKTPKSVNPPIPASTTVVSPAAVSVAETTAPAENKTWETIRAKLLSESPSDWRLGIIEADIYLDKVLDSKNFFGDTLGDKLKALTPGDLPSLQLAWEAHKVRNRIAHDGADFSLTMPEARRTLSYFEIVFRDLGVIA